MVKVNIPTQIGGGVILEEANTVRDLLTKLDIRLSSSWINIFINDEDIRFLKGKDTILKDGDEIDFIPSVAGG